MSLTGKLGGLLKRLVALDNDLSARLTLTEETGWQRMVAVLGAHLGDGPLWFVIAVVAFVLGGEETRRFVLLAAVAAIVTVGLTTVLKLLIRRSRPREATGFYSTRYDRHSFPSGHATRVACLAMIFSRQFPCWAIVFYALALFVSLCRIALDIHYISDILAGLVIGFLVSWGVVFIWW
jgi:undecaprenyl-diphosphatase